MYSTEDVISHAIRLSNSDYLSMLEQRAKLIEKFLQLKPGMKFLVSSGLDYNDYYEHTIKSVDFVNYTFDYIDNSLPEFDKNYGKIQTSSILNIPFRLYENKEKFEKREQFVFQS